MSEIGAAERERIAQHGLAHCGDFGVIIRRGADRCAGDPRSGATPRRARGAALGMSNDDSARPVGTSPGLNDPVVADLHGIERRIAYR